MARINTHVVIISPSFSSLPIYIWNCIFELALLRRSFKSLCSGVYHHISENQNFRADLVNQHISGVSILAAAGFHHSQRRIRLCGHFLIRILFAHTPFTISWGPNEAYHKCSILILESDWIKVTVRIEGFTYFFKMGT